MRSCVAFIAMAALAGCYRPSFQSCELQCAPGASQPCPEGYSCSNGRCAEGTSTCSISGDDGGTQTVYEELNVMSADYTFIPPHDTDWWLLLRNSGPTDMTIMVTAELYGAITWSPQ